MTDNSGEPLKFGSYYTLFNHGLTQYIGEEHDRDGRLYYRFVAIVSPDGDRSDDDIKMFPNQIEQEHVQGLPRLLPFNGIENVILEDGTIGVMPVNDILEDVVKTDEDLPTPSGGRRKKYRKTRNKKTYRKTRNKKKYRKTRKTRNKKRV
jgi:hypothetical protein